MHLLSLIVREFWPILFCFLEPRAILKAYIHLQSVFYVTDVFFILHYFYSHFLINRSCFLGVKGVYLIFLLGVMGHGAVTIRYFITVFFNERRCLLGLYLHTFICPRESASQSCLI